MEEQREQRIAKAYKRQREEEAVKQQKAKRPRSDEVRTQFYDSVFSGSAGDDDDIVKELYGKKKAPKTDATKPSKSEKPAASGVEEQEDSGHPKKKESGGVVHSKASKAWRAEEKRRVAEQKAAREKKLEREKKERQRRTEHKLLAKRTKKGQPVMANVVSHLLKKLEKQVGSSTTP